MNINHMRDRARKAWHGPELSVVDGIILIFVILIFLFTW